MSTTRSRRSPEEAGGARFTHSSSSAVPRGDDPAEAPEVLVGDARRRQQGRWAFCALAIVSAVGLAAALAASFSRPLKKPPPKKPPPKSHRRWGQGAALLHIGRCVLSSPGPPLDCSAGMDPCTHLVCSTPPSACTSPGAPLRWAQGCLARVDPTTLTVLRSWTLPAVPALEGAASVSLGTGTTGSVLVARPPTSRRVPTTSSGSIPGWVRSSSERPPGRNGHGRRRHSHDAVDRRAFRNDGERPASERELPPTGRPGGHTGVGTQACVAGSSPHPNVECRGRSPVRHGTERPDTQLLRRVDRTGGRPVTGRPPT